MTILNIWLNGSREPTEWELYCDNQNRKVFTRCPQIVITDSSAYEIPEYFHENLMRVSDWIRFWHLQTPNVLYFDRDVYWNYVPDLGQVWYNDCLGGNHIAAMWSGQSTDIAKQFLIDASKCKGRRQTPKIYRHAIRQCGAIVNTFGDACQHKGCVRSTCRASG